MYNSPSAINEDVLANLEWLHANKAALGISTIIANGESMGGKLTLALGINLKRQGKLHLLDGLYAQCPYISNQFEPPNPELTSLLENVGAPDAVAGIGGLTGQHIGTFLVEAGDASLKEEALVWPLYASDDDLSGWPATVISVNETDVLRDLGLAFYRKLKVVAQSHGLQPVADLFCICRQRESLDMP